MSSTTTNPPVKSRSPVPTLSPTNGDKGGAQPGKDAAKPEKKKGLSSEKLKALWPDIWAMVRPRRWLLLAGLVLMGINRVAGLVLPWSTKSLIDDVITKHQQ